MSELRFVLPYLKRHKWMFLLGILFVTISNICSTIYPKIVGATIDLIKTQQFGTQEIVEKVMYLLLFTVGSGFFMFLTRKTIIVGSRKIEYELRRDFLAAVEKQSLSFFNRTPTGSLMALASNDIASMREFLGPAIMYSANTVTTFTFAMYVMLSTNAQLTLIALIPLPLIAFSTFYIGRKVHVAYKEMQEQYSVVTTQAQEVFSGIRIIKSFVREENEAEIFHNEGEKYRQKNVRLAMIQSLTQPLMLFLIGTSNILVLGYGGYLITKGTITLGVITQFFMYITQLIWPVAAIGWVTNLVQRASASANRLNKVFSNVPDIINSGTLTNVNDSTVEFEDVGLQYPNTIEPAIKEINLKVPSNSTLGIIGAVGSGKSTLLRLVTRLFDTTSGSVKIGGVDIKELDLHYLRRIVSVVPQEPFLFSMSILDNIKFGNPNATESEIIHYSKLAMLHNEVEEMEDGYNTLIGERGVALSGGQRQRLAIARALIANPKILILDDCLSAVDAYTEHEILQGLKSLQTLSTTFIISHRISTLQHANQIVVLSKGSIVEQGNHDALIQKRGEYFAMNERQQLETELS